MSELMPVFVLCAAVASVVIAWHVSSIDEKLDKLVAMQSDGQRVASANLVVDPRRLDALAEQLRDLRGKRAELVIDYDKCEFSPQFVVDSALRGTVIDSDDEWALVEVEPRGKRDCGGLQALRISLVEDIRVLG